MAGSRLGESMNPLDIVIIALILVSLAAQLFLARSIVDIVRQGIAHLDESLAKALQETMASLPGIAADSFQEPPNPIQALLAQYLGERLKPPSLEVKEITRSDDGKFA